MAPMDPCTPLSPFGSADADGGQCPLHACMFIMYYAACCLFIMFHVACFLLRMLSVARRLFIMLHDACCLFIMLHVAATFALTSVCGTALQPLAAVRLDGAKSTLRVLSEYP